MYHSNRPCGSFVPRALYALSIALFGAGSIGLSTPAHAQRDLYVSNRDGNNISKVTPAGTVTVFATGLSQPHGIAFDATGNLYVANNNIHTISKISPAGVVTNNWATGLSLPVGLTFDATGNLYVANQGTSTITKITFSAPGVFGAASPYATGVVGLEDIAFDGADLYAADYNENRINKIAPGGAVTPFALGISNPIGLAFDTSHNLYASTAGSTITKIDPLGNGSLFASGGGLSGTFGEAFDNGVLYVTNFNNDTLSKISSLGSVSTFVDNTHGLLTPAYLAFSSSTVTPEPGTLALLGTLGISGGVFTLRRRRSRRAA